MMAALSESDIINSKPIGEGLAVFRESFKSICAELGVAASADAVELVVNKSERHPNVTSSG